MDAVNGHADHGARIEELVRALDGGPDDEARAAARELVALVLDLHGNAWARLMALVDDCGDAPALRAAMLDDRTIAEILLLHGLHPDAPAASEAAESRPPAVAVVPVSRITVRATGERIAGARA